MMFGLSYLKLAAVGAALALLLASYVTTYRMGVANERAASLARSVEVLRERNKTDGEIRNLDDAGLCIKLGGVWNGGACE